MFNQSHTVYIAPYQPLVINGWRVDTQTHIPVHKPEQCRRLHACAWFNNQNNNVGKIITFEVLILCMQLSFMYKLRHTVVCHAAKKVTRNTCVIYAYQNLTDFYLSYLTSGFLPNLHILCSTYTSPYILLITPAVHEIFVLENHPIFFVFFFFVPK